MTWLLIIGLALFWFIGWIISLFDHQPKPTPVTQEERRRRWQEREDEDRRRHEAGREKQLEVDRAETERIWKQHDDLIGKFLEITERKVSILDDYGDESWSALPKQIQECLIKIGERESIDAKQVREWLKLNNESKWHLQYEKGREKQFGEIGLRLEQKFRDYHVAHGVSSTEHSQDLNELSGQEFETYLARLLPRLGFTNVRGTPNTGDQGADILASKDGRSFVIQAKRQSSPVGNKAVQEIAAALNFYTADEAWVVTNSTFTPAAKALAQRNNVRLVDGLALSIDRTTSTLS